MSEGDALIYKDVTGVTDSAAVTAALDVAGGDLEAAILAHFDGAPDGAAPTDPPRQATPAEPVSRNSPQRNGDGDGDGGGGGAAATGFDAGRVIDRMFDQAKQVTEDEVKAETVRKRTPFSGRGHSMVAKKEPEQAGHATSPAEPEELLKRINITFYANGFIPDIPDAEFHELTGDESRKFLKELERGYVPRQLADQVYANEADPNARLKFAFTLIDRRGKTYTPPARPLPRFGGTGNTLGSAAPATAPAPRPLQPAVADPEPGWAEWLSGLLAATREFVMQTLGLAPLPPPLPPAERGAPVVDRDRSVVTVRLRLPDRSRHDVELNAHHTVADLAEMAGTVVEVGPGQAIALVAGFPPKPLADMDATLGEAKLGGEIVTVGLKTILPVWPAE